jgi:hypothetical protein
MPRVPKGEVAFVVTVELINRNKEAIKPSEIVFLCSVGKDNAEANEIIDIDAGVKGAPGTALLPGKKAKFKLAFQAPANEANPVINLNANPYNIGAGITTGLFQGKLKG